MIKKETFSLLQKELILEEGLKLKPYKDIFGNWSFGIGWNLDAMPLTKDQAIYINTDHINYFDNALAENLAFYDTLDEVRKAVLINMAFNLGMNGLMQFNKFLNLLSIKSYKAAAAEMLNSIWAKQVGKRAKRLAGMIETGCWYTSA